MKKLNVSAWHRWLKDGQEDMQDDPRSGQPKTQRTDANVENTEVTLAEKTKHVSLAVQDHACVFPRSQQGDEFIAQGPITNQQCYFEALTRLRESVWRKRPKLWHDKWILHHDNTPAHYALRVREFLAKKSITKMNHPAYSPDFAPAIFGSFEN
jgi:hypothetical protein